MSKKNKNKGGENEFNKKDKIEKIKINSSLILKEEFKEGMTLEDMKNKNEKENLIKNLISVVIIVSGLFLGSLFVDITQLLMKGGYSERALRKADVFELGDRTWVAYQEPAIMVKVLTVENKEDCLACDADEILAWMKKFIPTMSVVRIVDNSEEGRNLIEKYQLKTIPAFVFDDKIEKSSFYQEEQVQEIFDRKSGGLVLNSAALGIPAGKYLDSPEEKEGDLIIGDRNAQVKLVTFLDFQSTYSRIFYEAAKEARKEFKEDQLVLIYKTFPSDLQDQSVNASLVGQCAYQQGGFEEMADMLFKNQEEWLLEDDFKIFDKYVLNLRLNKKEFDECINSEKSRNLIQDLIKQGNDFGIAGTPTSFIDGKYLEGIFQKEAIVAVISEKLKKD